MTSAFGLGMAQAPRYWNGQLYDDTAWWNDYQATAFEIRVELTAVNADGKKPRLGTGDGYTSPTRVWQEAFVAERK